MLVNLKSHIEFKNGLGFLTNCYFNPFTDHDHTPDPDHVIVVLVHEVTQRAEAVQNLVTKDPNRLIDALNQMKRDQSPNLVPNLDLAAGKKTSTFSNLISFNDLKLIKFVISRSRSVDKQNGMKNDDK